MEHSKNYEKIRLYYLYGYWTKKMVYNVVAKGQITSAEYEEITGEPYEA